MYRQFKNRNEADELLGKYVTICGDKAQLIEIKIKKGNLFFNFEFEDGTTELLNSISALYSVRIDGHLFGLYEKKMIKEFTPEEKSEYNRKHKKLDYQKHRQARLDYQASYYQIHKEEIKERKNNRYKIKCGLSPIL